jgi:hypothetical protein
MEDFANSGIPVVDASERNGVRIEFISELFIPKHKLTSKKFVAVDN